MTITNHDTSTSGTDIEITVFYDSDIAQHDFDETIHMLQHDGYRTTARAWYVGCDGDPRDVPTYLSECIDLSGVTIKEARQWAVDQKLDGNWCTARDIVGEAREYYDGDWLEFAREILADRSVNELFDDDAIGIGVEKYNVVSIRGYSQGDYAEVLFDPEKFNGDDSAARDHFTRLFFDQPIYARVEVDGKEYYLDELMEDMYEWNRDKLIAAINVKWANVLPAKVREWICENLPEHPEYS